ncbi:fluoride efflux transporter FluC [Xylanimonas ulmi]|uniref:Fluoride-specific ion channel FluC n=1 Tax=Xylanimonas ulmi TaxID=228973 RepID=A0A4Q7M168_9MICO|nr:CrcB family protein [Xylanibacterium ulmi]RZS60118.1 CrcB protein [Xylanibacterium ulmi]
MAVTRGGASTLASAGLVALGGCVGVAARYGLEERFPASPGAWPWTTFWINVVGSLLLGALLETLLRTGPDDGWRRTARLGCGTGVMGGFTTYSTFAVETVRLAEGGQVWLGVGYALASVALGILAAVVGIGVAAGLWRRATGMQAPSRAGGHA